MSSSLKKIGISFALAGTALAGCGGNNVEMSAAIRSAEAACATKGDDFRCVAAVNRATSFLRENVLPNETDEGRKTAIKAVCDREVPDSSTAQREKVVQTTYAGECLDAISANTGLGMSSATAYRLRKALTPTGV